MTREMDVNRLVVIMSPKKTTARMVCKTPRTADEIMCVNGEVTLICSVPAKLIMNPKNPYWLVLVCNF